MKVCLYSLELVCLLIMGGCSTMEKQTPELIRSREPVLFEGTANFGTILNNDTMIGWEGVFPLTVTPTTLYFGPYLLSFSVMDSVEVTDFDDSGFGIFLGPRTYEDLLIIKTRKSLFRPCYNGCVFVFRLDKRQAAEPGHLPTQSELAGQVAALINSQRASLDPFGRLNGPRKVWLSVGTPWSYYHWVREPYYLMEKFPEQRKAIDELFKGARSVRSEIFRNSLHSYLLGRTEENGYSFEPLPEAASKIRGNYYPPDIKNALKYHEPSLDSVLVATGNRLMLEEKISPQGDISIKVSFYAGLHFCDLNPPKEGESRTVIYEISLPVQEWLDGGIARIEQAVEDAAILSVSEINDLLNPVSAARGAH